MLKKIKQSIISFIKEYKPLIQNNALMKITIAGIISSFGSKISYFALLKKVMIISNGKILDLGFLTSIQIVPSILLAPFAGIIIDKLPRKWIMIISDICSGLAILATIFVNDLQYIYLIAFIKAAVNVFRFPAQSSFEPNLVSKDNIPLLNSFKASSNSIIQIIGSATGAAVVGFMGLKLSFIIDAATFWVSAMMILTIMIQELHVQNEKINFRKIKFIKEFVDGASIVWKNSKLKLMVSIELFLTLAMSMQGVLIYYFIGETLRMGDQAELAWGILLSALGVGTIIGSFVIGILVKRYENPFKLFLNALFFDGVILALFSLNTYFPLSILLFTLLGVVSAANMIILNSVLQKTVPDDKRGRVFSSLDMLRGPISLLSILVGTTTASLITAQGVLLIAAFLELLIALGVRFSSTFIQVDGEVETKSKVI